MYPFGAPPAGAAGAAVVVVVAAGAAVVAAAAVVVGSAVLQSAPLKPALQAQAQLPTVPVILPFTHGIRQESAVVQTIFEFKNLMLSPLSQAAPSGRFREARLSIAALSVCGIDSMHWTLLEPSQQSEE